VPLAFFLTKATKYIQSYFYQTTTYIFVNLQHTFNVLLQMIITRWENGMAVRMRQGFTMLHYPTFLALAPYYPKFEFAGGISALPAIGTVDKMHNAMSTLKQLITTNQLLTSSWCSEGHSASSPCCHKKVLASLRNSLAFDLRSPHPPVKGRVSLGSSWGGSGPTLNLPYQRCW
jgi:hypothetical protein